MKADFGERIKQKNNLCDLINFGKFDKTLEMNIQYISDDLGNKTAVVIPIEDWEILKEKYADLQTEENQYSLELASWQKEIIDERLNDYYENPNDVIPFDVTIANIRKSL